MADAYEDMTGFGKPKKRLVICDEVLKQSYPKVERRRHGRGWMWVGEKLAVRRIARLLGAGPGSTIPYGGGPWEGTYMLYLPDAGLRRMRAEGVIDEAVARSRGAA